MIPRVKGRLEAESGIGRRESGKVKKEVGKGGSY